MKIKDLFKKDINRHIEGVIKAEDKVALKNELEEFVITDEIKTYLETFFENYNEGNSNGAWISGFFGSGRARHLPAVRQSQCVRHSERRPIAPPVQGFFGHIC